MTMTMAMTIAMTMMKKMMMVAMMTTTTTITKTVALFSFEAFSDHGRIVTPLSRAPANAPALLPCSLTCMPGVYNRGMISTAMLSFMHAHTVSTCMHV